MTQDTRKDRRVKIVSLNVRYKSATVDEFIDNHALDVSRGGIYIKTNNPFSPGTLLKFEIRLVSDQAVITGVGRVVWKRDAVHGAPDRPPGMGVKFIKVDDPSRALIDKLVNTRADAGKAFESEPEAKGSPGSKRISTPPTVHTATRVGHPSSPSMRKGTIVGLGGAAGSPNVPSRAQSPGAPGTASQAAAVPRPTSTPPLGSAATGTSGATVRPGAEGPGATVRPGAEFSGATIRPGSNVSGATLRPGVQSSPPVHDGFGASGPEPPTSPHAMSVASRGPSVPPRPGPTLGNMFPKRLTSSVPPKGEATVMKQAAELLEEALREAGGSMDDVGTNPLFSGGAGAAGSTGSAESAQPRPLAFSSQRSGDQAEPEDAGDHDDQGAPAKDDAANARAMVAAMAPGPVQRRRSADAIAPGADLVPDARGLALEESSAPSDSLRAPVDEGDSVQGVSARKKGGAGKWLLLLAAALGVAAYVYRAQIVGAIAVAERTYAPAAPNAAAAPGSIPSASAPIAQASATSEPAAHASASAPVAPEASASASAEAALTAAPSAAGSSMPAPRGGQPYTQRPAVVPAYVAARPRPAPTATATAAPTAPESAAASSVEAPSKESDPAGAPPAAASASAAATAAPATAGPSGGNPASKARSSSRSPDDNPY